MKLNKDELYRLRGLPMMPEDYSYIEVITGIDKKKDIVYAKILKNQIVSNPQLVGIDLYCRYIQIQYAKSIEKYLCKNFNQMEFFDIGEIE